MGLLKNPFHNPKKPGAPFTFTKSAAVACLEVQQVPGRSRKNPSRPSRHLRSLQEAPLQSIDIIQTHMGFAHLGSYIYIYIHTHMDVQCIKYNICKNKAYSICQYDAMYVMYVYIQLILKKYQLYDYA